MNIKILKSLNVKTVKAKDGPYGLVAIPGGIRAVPYKSHHKVHAVVTAKNSLLPLPAEIREMAGFGRKTKPVLQIKGRALYFLDSSFEGEYEDFDSAPGTRVIPEQESSTLGIAEETKFSVSKAVKFYNTTVLPIPKNILRKAKFDSFKEISIMLFHNGTNTWLEIGQEDELPDINRHDFRARFRAKLNPEISGIAFRDHFFVRKEWTAIYLPIPFRNTMKASVYGYYPVWWNADDRKIVIEEPQETCEICGDKIRSTTPEHPQWFTACEDCKSKLGPSGAIDREIHSKF